jgi:hypothetical protein
MERLLQGRHLDNVPREQASPARPEKEQVLDIVAGIYKVTHKDIVMRHHAEFYHTTA